MKFCHCIFLVAKALGYLEGADLDPVIFNHKTFAFPRTHG